MVKQSVLWRKIETHYTIVPQEPNSTFKNIKYQCNYCSQTYACNVTRMSLHLMRDCPAPMSVKEEIRNIYTKSESSSPYKHFKLNARWGQVSRHFVKLNTENFPNCKKDKYMCIYCNNRYANNVTRMAQHVMECAHCPSDTKNEFYLLNKPKVPSLLAGLASFEIQTYEEDQNSTNETTFFYAAGFENADNVNPISSNSYDEEMDPVEQKYDISNHIHEGIENIETNSSVKLDINDKTEEDEINILISRACYATSTPLNIFENIHWQKVFKKISPNLSLPTQSELSNEYLNKEYQRINKEVENKIGNARKLTIELTGICNNKKLTTIVIILSTPEPVVYDILDAKSFCTSKFLAKIIEENKNHIFLPFVYKNCDVTDVIDNLNSTFSNRYLSIYRCHRYVLNLLIKDIMGLNIFKNSLRKYKSIIKVLYLETTSPVCFQIRKNIANLCFPSLKYWKPVYDNLEKLIKNKFALQHFAKSPENKHLSKEIIKNLFDEKQFWLYIGLLVNVIKSIAVWLQKIKPESCISSVVECYSDLRNVFENTLSISEKDKICILECLGKSRNSIIQEIHKAASLLDPHCMGKNLSPDEVIDAIEFINKLSKILPDVKSDKIMYDIAAYRTKQGIWGKEFVWDSLSTSTANHLPAVIWWQSMCSSTELCKIAVAVLTCPPTVVPIEKFCDKHKYHNEKTKKIAYIKYNLKLLAIGDSLYGNNEQIENDLMDMSDEDSNYSSDSESSDDV